MAKATLKVTAVGKLPRGCLDPRTLAIPKKITAKCAVPLRDGRIAAVGRGTLEVYSKAAKLLASVECRNIEQVVVVRGNIAVAATLGGSLVVFAIGATIDEVAKLRTEIDCHTLSSAGDRVFARAKTGNVELVGLDGITVPATAATNVAPGAITLAPVNAASIPEDDTFDPTEVDWDSHTRRPSSFMPAAIAVRADYRAAVVLTDQTLWWAPSRGKGKRIASFEQAGSVSAAQFIADDAIVVLAERRLSRFTVAPTAAKLTKTHDLELGAGLAVRSDRKYVAVLEIAAGRKLGCVRVFDAALRELAKLDRVAAVRAAGGRLFAVGAKAKTFEILGLL